MNPELELKVQAWVDGQLDPSEAREVAALIDRDPACRALADNLRAFTRRVREHEPVRTVPESRDFYWSAIRRGIEQAERPAAPSPAAADTTAAGLPWLRWLAWIIPAGAAALTVLFLLRPHPGQDPDSLSAARLAAHSNGSTQPPLNHEVEAPTDQIATLTFYSAQDEMTVVWLGQVDLF